MSRRLTIAIDGPAGAGKSTVSRELARRLGYTLLDTGALYRSVALAADREGLDLASDEAVGALAEGLARRGEIVFEPGEGGRPLVRLGGEDVTDAIRTQQISQGASRVSALPRVRTALLDIQRAAGAAGGVVLEGRDIGTVVLPDADLKFFLTASVTVRAARRQAELAAKGEVVELGSVEREVIERDERDSGRAVAPLRQAPDAVVVDSSGLPIEGVLEAMLRAVSALGGEPVEG